MFCCRHNQKLAKAAPGGLFSHLWQSAKAKVVWLSAESIFFSIGVCMGIMTSSGSSNVNFALMTARGLFQVVLNQANQPPKTQSLR